MKPKVVPYGAEQVIWKVEEVIWKVHLLLSL